MRLTVIICAYTMARTAALTRAVESVLSQERPVDELLVVIDHNHELESWARSRLSGLVSGSVRVLANSGRRGLSGARNTGVEQATGDVVAFLDDDAAVEPDWAARLLEPYADPDVAGVGGWVEPLWSAPRPAWFPEEFLWVVGCSYRGLPTARAQVRNPIGANMSFRRSALAAAGAFTSHVGRVGDDGAGCEETELAIRVGGLDGGRRILLEPGARCRHEVTADRTTRGYFRSRCAAEGRSKALIGTLVGAGPALASERTYVARTLPAGLLRELGSAARGDRAALTRGAAVVEGLGIVAASYLLTRVRLATGRRRGAGTVPTPDAGPDFTPIWCGELELRTGVLASVVPAGPEHRRSRVLVRERGVPRGYLQVPRPPQQLDVAELTARAEAELPRVDEEASPQAADDPVTVAVCTRDRADQLRPCLDRLAGLTHPALEIMVVDNAPTDGRTRELVEAYRERDPRFRYVLAPEPGLSPARNVALHAARHDLVAFTDDDVSVDPEWVAGIVHGFHRHPSVSLVTGLVATAGIGNPAEAYFDARSANWSTEISPRLFGRTGPGPLYPYSPGIFGTGANLAVRRTRILELGGFDELLGAGKPTRGGEDLDIFVRVIRAGDRIAYEPTALVWHHHRADEQALRRQLYGYGTGMAAYGTKLLLDPATRWQVLTRVPLALVRLSGIAKETSAATTPPQGVLRTELRGYLTGPWIYVRGRREQHRVAAGGVVTPVGGAA